MKGGQVKSREKKGEEDGGEGKEDGEERREGGGKKREKEYHRKSQSGCVWGSPTTSNSPDQNLILRKNNLGTAPFEGSLLIPEDVIIPDIYVFSKPFTKEFIPANPFPKNSGLL